MDANISISMIILAVIVLVVIGIIVKNVQIVPQSSCRIIERLGKYKATWQAGLHVKVPFIDNVVRYITLKEQVLDYPPQNVITKDNVTMQIDSVVYATIFDPKKFTYGAEDPSSGLRNLTATTLRSIIGEMELDETLSSREVINGKMQKILDEATDAWGICVSRVEIKNIIPPAEIEEVMTKQMRAERERRETLLQAQAHKESVVAMAEGDRQAKVLAAEAEKDAAIALAEGKAKSIKLVYEAEADGIRMLANSQMNDNVLRLKSIEAMKDVADGQATKIFIPTDLSQSIASMGILGDMLGTAEQKTSDVSREQLRESRIQAKANEKLEKDSCVYDLETNEITLKAAESNAKTASELNEDISR